MPSLAKPIEPSSLAVPGSMSINNYPNLMLTEIETQGIDWRVRTPMPKPPDDGHPLGVALKARQHEVQVVARPNRCLAAAWTDDEHMRGIRGWTCGFSLSFDDGQSSTFHSSTSISTTQSPETRRSLSIRAGWSLPSRCVRKRTTVAEFFNCAPQAMPVGPGRPGGRYWPNTTAFPIGLVWS